MYMYIAICINKSIDRYIALGTRTHMRAHAHAHTDAHTRGRGPMKKIRDQETDRALAL